MALKKTITNKNGVTTEYHKIDSIFIATRGDGLILRTVVKSYVSEDIRHEDLALSVTESFNSFSTTSEELESKPVYAFAYEMLKSTEMFAMSEDC